MAAQPDWTPMPNGVVSPPTLWKALLLRGKPSKTGEPGPILAHLANAITALRHAPEWDGVLAFNEFSLATVALRSPPWEGTAVGAEWTDHEDRLTANWLQHAGVCVSVEVAGQAVQSVARDRKIHPVREYLQSLKWDGAKRLDNWLALYVGADTTDYTAAVGARWLISAVARIYQPGAKADCALILEGKQGQFKSTSLKILGEPWFTDEIAVLGSKDASLQTIGVWIIEIGELDSMSRADVGRIKGFMSRTTDRFRPPYGKHLLNCPRQCVFAGSVNNNTYLRDETGARRFWPISCTGIRVDDLRRDRDQLWAEAVVRYRDGAVWWMDSPELTGAAEIAQSERFEEDPWLQLIAPWLIQPSERYDDDGHPMVPRITSSAQSVTIQDILTHCIGKRQEQWLQTDKNRVSRSLHFLGWERYRQRTGNTLEWRYRKGDACS